MTSDDVVGILKSLSTVANAIPAPAGTILEAVLELGIEAVQLGTADPVATIDELRAMLKAGVTWDLQQELNKKS